jgi:hypothetical protein
LVPGPFDQRRQSAEQPYAAFDLGQDGVGWRNTHVRREREQQRRHFRQRRFFRARVAIAQHDIGRERERRGDQLAVADAGSARASVRGDHARIVAVAGDDERVLRVRRCGACEDVERKRRQQKAGPQHRGAPMAVGDGNAIRRTHADGNS